MAVLSTQGLPPAPLGEGVSTCVSRSGLTVVSNRATGPINQNRFMTLGKGHGSFCCTKPANAGQQLLAPRGSISISINWPPALWEVAEQWESNTPVGVNESPSRASYEGQALPFLIRVIIYSYLHFKTIRAILAFVVRLLRCTILVKGCRLFPVEHLVRRGPC